MAGVAPLPSNLYHQDDITLLLRGFVGIQEFFQISWGFRNFTTGHWSKQIGMRSQNSDKFSHGVMSPKKHRGRFLAPKMWDPKNLWAVLFPDFLKSSNSGISTFRAPQQKIDSTCPKQKTCIYPKNPANIYQVFDSTTAYVRGRTLLERVILRGCSKARSLKIYSNDNCFQKEWIVFQLSFCMGYVIFCDIFLVSRHLFTYFIFQFL